MEFVKGNTKFYVCGNSENGVCKSRNGICHFAIPHIKNGNCDTRHCYRGYKCKTIQTKIYGIDEIVEE